MKIFDVDIHIKVMVKIFDSSSASTASVSASNIIISGGGLAGLSTSLGLVKLGYSVGKYILYLMIAVISIDTSISNSYHVWYWYPLLIRYHRV